jgi:CubicO group peptidase (beta-lactamase class C family)
LLQYHCVQKEPNIAMTNTFVIPILLLVFAGCKAQSQESEVDKIIGTMVPSGSAGVTVAVAREGDILFSKGYGLANIEYNIPNSPATIFHVASVSKQFTALRLRC